jgi:DNA-binding SARP family transcriptional activator
VIEVGLLGSIVVQVEDNRVELAGVLEKALLARLSLSPGSDVSQSRLIDDLWGETSAELTPSAVSKHSCTV